MQGVRGVGGPAKAGGTRGARASVGKFMLSTSTEAARDVAPAAAATPIAAALLGLQEEAGAEARNIAARRRAEAMLRELAALQRGVLGGVADRAGLDRLARLGEGAEAADPALRELVRAIALRAAVELARRGWNGLASTM